MGRVVIDIDKATGDIKISVDGVAGPSCLDLTKVLEEGLCDVTERRKTDEFDTNAMLQADVDLHQQRG